jgi:hypothetical protein
MTDDYSDEIPFPPTQGNIRQSGLVKHNARVKAQRETDCANPKRNITTEEIDLLAQTHDLARFTLGMKTPEHDLTAAALRSLAAERDALRAKVERPESGVSYETFVSAMQIVTTERDALKAENARLREALREIKNKARTGRPPFMSTKTDYFQIASAALGETQ